MTKLVALDSRAHRFVRVRTDKVEAEGAVLHLIPVVVSEFMQLVVQYPIVFTKHAETGEFLCSAMMGLDAGENLFWEQGKWQGIYIPLQVVRQPLFLGQDDESEGQYVICLDAESDCLSDNDGEALFDDSGDPTAYLEAQNANLVQLLEGEFATSRFIEKMLQLKLVTPLSLEITLSDGSSHTVTGIYTIDEDALQALSPELLVELQQDDYLRPIYAMIASQGQIYNLIDRKNKMLENARQWFQ
ncbi:SapC family protein [Paraneptunicella aestuarii]|uniref:SapC family protein n=1 Tax=Paraneptunicella aestuarii TaxID=2831148 RepID=UPI001E4A48AF|nr:SapC family protein [Paraneptunicella aestuarii]UAA40349.1 SapC family protein [Paraneptunicella aestuarii]